MVNIFQRYILVFLSKAKRALFRPFQLRALSLSLSLWMRPGVVPNSAPCQIMHPLVLVGLGLGVGEGLGLGVGLGNQVAISTR